MKTKLFLLTALVLACVSAAMAQKGNSADEKILIENEKTAWKNLVDKNYDAFGTMFADDYLGVYPNAVTTKTSELAEVRQITFKSAEVSDVKVSFPTKGTAIVTSVVKMDIITPDGKTTNENVRATSFLAKRGGKWMIVYHSHTPLMEM